MANGAHVNAVVILNRSRRLFSTADLNPLVFVWDSNERGRNAYFNCNKTDAMNVLLPTLWIFEVADFIWRASNPHVVIDTCTAHTHTRRMHSLGPAQAQRQSSHVRCKVLVAQRRQHRIIASRYGPCSIVRKHLLLIHGKASASSSFVAAVA